MVSMSLLMSPQLVSSWVACRFAPCLQLAAASWRLRRKLPYFDMIRRQIFLPVKHLRRSVKFASGFLSVWVRCSCMRFLYTVSTFAFATQYLLKTQVRGAHLCRLPFDCRFTTHNNSSTIQSNSRIICYLDSSAQEPIPGDLLMKKLRASHKSL